MRYAFFTVSLTRALAGLFLVGVRVPFVGSLIVTLYFLWSPWHFTGQNFGLALVFLRRRGVEIPAGARHALRTTFVLGFVFPLVQFMWLGGIVIIAGLGLALSSTVRKWKRRASEHVDLADAKLSGP